MTADIASHYQQVSKAWRLIMGRYQHFTYCDTAEAFDPDILDTQALEQASQHLVDALLGFTTINTPINKDSHILDVGCGQGGSAFYLQQVFHCKVTGIALGQYEIEAANRQAQALKLGGQIQFHQVDAQDNGLASESFSHIVMLESSLLVPDKAALFRENYRVLEQGGTLLICDQIKLKAASPKQMYQYGKQVESLEASFGKTSTESMATYCQLLEESGFSGIVQQDVSKKVSASPLNWKNNALRQKQALKDIFTETQFQYFIDACDALYLMMQEGILGYAFFKAEKPRS